MTNINIHTANVRAVFGERDGSFWAEIVFSNDTTVVVFLPSREHTISLVDGINDSKVPA